MASTSDWPGDLKDDWWKSVITQSEHEAFEIELHELKGELVREMRRQKHTKSVVDTLMYLRTTGLTLKECMAISRRIGERRKTGDKQKPITSSTVE